MPCGDREDKKLLLPKNKRLQLMKSLFEGTPNVKICQDEIEMSTRLGKAVHTYDLFSEMKKTYEDVRFSLVVGGDVLLTIHTWGNSEKLQKENHFIIFNRKGYTIPERNLPPNYTLVEAELPDVSSSAVKQLIQEKNVSGEEKLKILRPWLDEKVLSFLTAEKLIEWSYY